MLEVKLSLPEGTEAPAWVRELTENPNRCTEVHKFSKFIHGTCTLFPALVQVRAPCCRARVCVLHGHLHARAMQVAMQHE